MIELIRSSRQIHPMRQFGATVADTLKNEVVSKLRSQYLDLAAREADWSVKYGHDHLAVVNLRNQMREIRNSIFDELKRLGETYKSDYEIAKQREAGRSERTSARRIAIPGNRCQVGYAARTPKHCANIQDTL